MVIPSDLKSTESITRFLRNKDSEVEDIYKYVTEKLFTPSDQNIAYLPQKEKFILELLVDRISQSNKLAQKFKEDSKTWELLNYVWDCCGNDTRLINIRTAVLSKIKLGETLTKLLNDFYAQNLYQNAELMEELANSLQHLFQTMKTHLSDDQSVNLVTNLLKFIVQNESYSHDLVLKLVELAINIFNFNNRGSLKYDTKHKSEFARSCLANLLIVSQKPELQGKKTELKSIIVKILFSDLETNASPNIVTYIEHFVAVDFSTPLPNKELLYLLQTMIPKITVAQLEEVAKLLINKFPAASSILIKEITDMNKTLSTEFLSTLVEKALANPTEDSYELIIHSMRRNMDITIKYTEQICNLCSSENVNSIALFKNLFDSYFRNRELDRFTNIWSHLVNRYSSNIFESDEIVDYVASKLVTLSFAQISKFVETEVSIYKSNPNENPVVLLAVCKCFLRGISGSIQNALNKTLIFNLHQLKSTLVSLLNIEGELSWKLKFYILCLFDLEDVEEGIKAIKNHAFIYDDYFFYTKLRVIEQDIEDIDKTFKKKLSSYFRKKAASDFQFTIFTRFYMVIEYVYNKEEIDLLVKSLIASSNEKTLETIVSNHVLQAQPQIISSIIDYCIEHEKFYKALKCISVYAFNKMQKEKALNIILDRLNEESSKDIINNLIKMPTYKSKLEADFSSLTALVNHKDTAYLATAEAILLMHFKQPAESKRYIDSVYENLLEAYVRMENSNCLEYKSSLCLTLLVLKVSRSERHAQSNTKLVETSINKVKILLSDSVGASTKIVNLLIHFLTEMNFLGEYASTLPDLRDTIAKLGSAYSKESDVKNNLFGLVCSSKELYPAKYIIALFIVLEGEENAEYFGKYIKTVSSNEQQFSEAWKCFSASIHQLNSGDLKKCIEICGYFIKHVRKPEDSMHIPAFRQWFVGCISETFTKIKENNFVVDNIIAFVSNLKYVTSAKTWLLTQYSMELILALVTDLSKILISQKDGAVSEIFICLCQIIASIILYQRRRLSNRHHMIICVFISLMKTLTIKSKEISVEGGVAFERLMSNFCEPTINQMTVRFSTAETTSKDAELNNALSQTKQGLRKNIPILIFNYIKLYLQIPTDLTIKPYIDNSVYMMLDLLTLNELNYINESLDHQGLLVFRNIHENYKKFYKWNEE